MKEEIQEINVCIQRGIFDRRQRQLIIIPDFIQFEDKGYSNSFTKFIGDEICEYRYGIKFIKGLEFTIGREFLIFIRNSSSEILKINFRAFYNIRREESYKLSDDILRALWKFYFSNIANVFIKEFYEGQEITVGRALITQEAIIVSDPGILRVDQTVISWEDLATKDYHNYFAIYSSKDASKINATFSYLNDWNTGVLFSVVRTILNNRNAS